MRPDAQQQGVGRQLLLSIANEVGGVDAVSDCGRAVAVNFEWALGLGVLFLIVGVKVLVQLVLCMWAGALALLCCIAGEVCGLARAWLSSASPS